MDQRPDRIKMPDRQARVLTEEGVTGKALLSQYEWHYDEPTEKGGNATAPAPVDHPLGALSACFAVTVRAEATKHDFDFYGLDISAEAEPKTGFVEAIDLTAGVPLITKLSKWRPLSNTASENALFSSLFARMSQSR